MIELKISIPQYDEGGSQLSTKKVRFEYVDQVTVKVIYGEVDGKLLSFCVNVKDLKNVAKLLD